MKMEVLKSLFGYLLIFIVMSIIIILPALLENIK